MGGTPVLKKLKRVLVANRGEIAVRIIRALRDLGIQSVAVYSDADRDSLHRKLADFSCRLSGNTSAETYLNIPALLDAVKLSQADGLHPGYGFLSENPGFVDQVTAIGCEFIGPPSSAMRQMGNKITAKGIMRKAGVPVVPGSTEALTKWEDIKTLADEIGYPLIIKAASGGGGRGMRQVHKVAELQDAFSACSREAKDYFGNPAVFCERYVRHGRHIEMQILFDKHGRGVHLFERDCSIQRRHQKLLEEAPSSFLNEAQRNKLGEIALAAGKSVGYVGAGTVEFICESPDKCYFMEMNTRIQVEHPVTEMITGIDLVKSQIKVAQGESLEFEQSEIKIHGWAFEARINAEDPLRDFLPCPGYIKEIHLPGGPGVRVDSHLYAGYTIPSFYDSMIAKVITWGKDRNAALERLKGALCELEVHGPPTTARFHEALIANESFRQGKFDTLFLEENSVQLLKAMQQSDVEADEFAAALAAVLVNQSVNQQTKFSADSRCNWAAKARREANGQGNF